MKADNNLMLVYPFLSRWLKNNMLYGLWVYNTNHFKDSTYSLNRWQDLIDHSLTRIKETHSEIIRKNNLSILLKDMFNFAPFKWTKTTDTPIGLTIGWMGCSNLFAKYVADNIEIIYAEFNENLKKYK